MKILKPSASFSSISIKVSSDLAKRVADAQAAAKERGLTFDLDQRLSRALARLLKQAEAELSDSLSDTSHSGQVSPPALPAATENLQAALEVSNG